MAQAGGLGPWSILQQAIKAVPQVKWALAVGGVIAVPAIVASWTKYHDIRITAISIIGMFFLMMIMVIFAKSAGMPGSFFYWPGVIFTWFCLILFIAVASSLFGSIFFNRPHLDWSFITHASAATAPIVTPAELEAQQLEATGDREAANGIYYTYCQWHTNCSEFGAAFLPTRSLQNWARAKLDWQSARDRTTDSKAFLRLKEKLNAANSVSCTSDADRKTASCQMVTGGSDELTIDGKMIQAMRPVLPTVP